MRIGIDIDDTIASSWKYMKPLYSKEFNISIDEINSIPTCFSHHLWEEANISYKELFTIMINDAIKNFNKDNEMITTMDMSVLKNLKNSDIREFK